MITLYTWDTPNGRKISIALEELGLDYDVIPINIHTGEQHAPEFSKISPSNKIPVINDGGRILFESGAILLYLAQKTAKLLASVNSESYWQQIIWLQWQVGNFGPSVGQAHHFLHYNKNVSTYSEQRYFQQTLKLYEDLNQQLSGKDFVTGSALSIADISIWPWVARFQYHKVDLNTFANVKRWYLQLAKRPSFEKGYKQPFIHQDIPLP